MIEDNTATILSKHEQARLKGILKVCQLIEGTAVMLCAVDKGDLRSSISYTCKNGKSGDLSLPGNADGIIGTNKEHAPHVEFGTRPHIITIKSARVLSDGKDIFGTQVNHPGTPAQPFMRPAMDQNINNANEIMKREMSEVTK
jgi:HK97 gp10 family phage protein